jgi:hypothetical protein
MVLTVYGGRCILSRATSNECALASGLSMFVIGILFTGIFISQTIISSWELWYGELTFGQEKPWKFRLPTIVGVVTSFGTTTTTTTTTKRTIACS